MRVDSATEQKAALQLIDTRGYNLRSVTLEPDATAVFRHIPLGRYFLVARTGNRIRRTGPFNYYRFQDGSGIRSSEHQFALR